MKFGGWCRALFTKHLLQVRALNSQARVISASGFIVSYAGNPLTFCINKLVAASDLLVGYGGTSSTVRIILMVSGSLFLLFRLTALFVEPDRLTTRSGAPSLKPRDFGLLALPDKGLGLPGPPLLQLILANPLAARKTCTHSQQKK